MASVSSRFHPDQPDMKDADLSLLATDAVFFYAHRAVLLRRSSNNFGGLVTSEHVVSQTGSQIRSSPDLILTNYRPEVLQVVLLALYELPMSLCDPSFETLCAVITALATLGYDLQSIAPPQSELFKLFLEAAEGDPLSIYAIAAQHSFEELAISASRFSLNKPIKNLSDELAEQMGTVYLRRLLRLHLQHTTSLRHLITPPPVLHPPTDDYPKCNKEMQESVNQTWLVVSAYVIVQNSSSGIQGMIGPFAGRVECPDCVQSLNRRIETFHEDWNKVRSSI
ncbi:hypothetical protein BDV93DRAFT_450177 [Ceratobasidium sp. AG-I]|nr:hypothetical protein BDV93DRAFT_450177 [Ceratobasidium sp. AG-I]